jgi:hypothetical protein
MWQGRNVADIGIDSSLAREFDDVVVTLTDKRTRITGLVRGGRGEVLSGVLAFPVDRTRWIDYGWSPARLRTAIAGSDGRYAIERLPEGEYFVIAVPASMISAWTDPSFLATAAPLATRVSLRWGDTRAQDLALVEVGGK